MAIPHTHSRREFIGILAAGAAALAGCGLDETTAPPTGGGSARLTARPGTPTSTATPGPVLLTASNPNDGYLVVPDGYDPLRPTPLVLAFAGAGGTPSNSIALLGPYAAAQGFLLLAVGARGLTWDVLTYKFSYDITFIDDALKFTYARCNVDTARTIVLGFSDGASYALALGLDNGDLLRRVVAFSAGFIPRSDSAPVGKAEFFVSHGRQDGVLPIANASRKFVPALQNDGYSVTYQEFDGGHEVPPGIAAQAVTWMLR